MPIYEYECTGCGKTFEIFQKIGDDPLTECRECGAVLNKLVSQCSFHLKGTGWYVTDYKKPIDTVGGAKYKETKEDVTSETKTETKSEAPVETKTETKSEATTETKSAGQAGG
ncbi:MAG: zinc ribbon domain-containing protein [Syntrophobacterales bacterium]|jgi:putative FmdB family regulatory protein|nr:zinc ribbon domain-containing protein [Syntrophobacterales bacterium]